jgi:type IV pilus assembly protein PilY1
LFAALVLIGPYGSVNADPSLGRPSIPIATAPVFALSGAAPNLILTIDHSNSMNQAFLPEGIWPLVGGTTLPKLDARDTSSLVNRQYYDPAQTYLPPKTADGSTKSHAVFSSAAADSFGSISPDCNLDLGHHYAPTWSLNNRPGKTGGSTCGDLRAATKEQIVKIYAQGGPANADLSVPEWEWAWRCMVSHAYGDCPAFYYRLRQTDACKDKLASLNLNTITATDFPSGCLTRVEVGSDRDLASVRDRTNALVTTQVLAERKALLKNPDGTTPGNQALAERNFANWYSFYRTRWLTLQTVVSRAFIVLPERVRFTYQTLPGSFLYSGTSALADLSSRFNSYDSNRSGFYSWLFTQRAVGGSTRLLTAAARVHEFCRTDLAYLQSLKTPLDVNLETNPVRGCRNNFHVMFTDGGWNDFIGTSPSGSKGLDPPATATRDGSLWLGNNDGTETAFPAGSESVPAMVAGGNYSPAAASSRIFADGNTGMLADLVFASWITDLRPNDPVADHLVPTLIRNRAGPTADRFWNPVNDPADWQHITTYTISLGVSGTVLYPSGLSTLQQSGFPGSQNAIGYNVATTQWKANEIPTAYKIDDLWHAGINGRGGYFNAGNPGALTTAFERVLQAVSSAAGAKSAAALAVDSGGTAADDLIYQARFDGSDWSGDIRSFRVSPGPEAAPCATPPPPAGQLCEDPLAGQYYRSAAAALVDRNATNRRIFTGQGATDTGIAFGATDAEWALLSNTQRLDFLRGAGYLGTDSTAAAADGGPTPAALAEAKAQLRYVAGERTYEVDGLAYRFRTRATLLGDIINAGPVLVGPPSLVFMADDYPGFIDAKKGRAKMLYAGANDGMLHAFDAASLSESFAFIPPVLIGLEGAPPLTGNRPGMLHLLSDPEYAHHNFVDGPLRVGDAWFDGAWHTVLAAGLGLGAQALYTLDVTNPPALGTTPAASAFADSMYLWQFTDRDSDAADGKVKGDPDLGYVLGQPYIARVRGALFGRAADSHPVWVVVSGNGYNSAEDDGSRAAGCDDATQDQDTTLCGQAVLYVIEIGGLRDVKKIPTGVGRRHDPLHQLPNDAADAAKRRPNALGQPRVIVDSTAADGDILGDYAYAADLFGHLYRFDLTGAPGAKAVRLLYTATDPSGKAQPITSPLAVMNHPTGVGDLVLFGTGKYLELDDPGDRQVQSFYAIWDKGDDSEPVVASRDPAGLLEQSFVATDLAVGDARGRTSSDLALDWSDPAHPKYGWYIDFDLERDGVGNKGERVVTEPIVLRKCVIFTSLIPETNPCVAGGYGWINMLNASSGGRPACTFDYTGDGTFDDDDLLPLEGGPAEGVAGSSFRLTSGGQNGGLYLRPSVTRGPRPPDPDNPDNPSCAGGFDIIRASSSDAGLPSANISTQRGSSGRVWQQLR